MNKDELNETFAKLFLSQYQDGMVFFTDSVGDGYYLTTRNGIRYLAVTHVMGKERREELVYVV